jgi:hypothetical protein
MVTRGLALWLFLTHIRPGWGSLRKLPTCLRVLIQFPEGRWVLNKKNNSVYKRTLTGQCSGAFSGIDLGSGTLLGGCSGANIVVAGDQDFRIYGPVGAPCDTTTIT